MLRRIIHKHWQAITQPTQKNGGKCEITVVLPLIFTDYKAGPFISGIKKGFEPIHRAIKTEVGAEIPLIEIIEHIHQLLKPHFGNEFNLQSHDGIKKFKVGNVHFQVLYIDLKRVHGPMNKTNLKLVDMTTDTLKKSKIRLYDNGTVKLRKCDLKGGVIKAFACRPKNNSQYATAI